MVNTTYLGRNIGKAAFDHLLAGSGEAASAAAAELKAQALDDLLQLFFQAGGLQFNGQDINPTDIKMAIAYSKGKKHTKAQRKAVIGTAKLGLQIAATAGGATIGSVVPVAGTVLGGVGGAIAGAGLGITITAADRIKRTAKGFYKVLMHTRGEHRKQAAIAFMYCASPQFNWADGRNAANEALLVILGDEYERVVGEQDVGRLADRLKSN
jgi:hypothetical protein